MCESILVQMSVPDPHVIISQCLLISGGEQKSKRVPYCSCSVIQVALMCVRMFPRVFQISSPEY